VQAMVFGNLGDDCADWRRPDARLCAGRARLLRRLSEFKRPGRRRRGLASYPQRIDVTCERTCRRRSTAHDIGKVLEKHLQRSEDIEFTVQKENLDVADAHAKRTLAAVRIVSTWSTKG